MPRFNFVSAGRAFRGSAIAPLLRNSFAAPTNPHASKLAGKVIVILGLDPRIFPPKIVQYVRSRDTTFKPLIRPFLGFVINPKKDSRVMTRIQHTVKKSFRHCERSAAVHFLDCHVASLLAMTKQEELVAFFTDIPNLLHSIPTQVSSQVRRDFLAELKLVKPFFR